MWLLYSCQPNAGTESTTNMSTPSTNKTIDWQGHRGARGLLPENTIQAFIKALEFPAVTTLELDVVVSKDQQIIISHEPWFSAAICSHPDGRPVTEEEEKDLRIYDLTYEQIKAFDCGSRGNERFPDQQKQAAFKPSLMDMVSNVEAHCEKNQLKRPNYNIELKSHPDGYGSMIPPPDTFVTLLLDELDLLSLKSRVTLQSFDLNILREIQRQDSSYTTALLIENLKNVDQNLDELGYLPNIYSPHWGLLNDTIIQHLHDKGIRVIPWTVNDPQVMKRLVEQGVDGIITDYPNLIPSI